MEGRITDKKTIGEKFGDKKLMDKKPMTSSKYKDVTKLIDTGKTIKDVPVLSDQFISKRKGELFKRIKPSTIIKLLDENHNSESIYNLADENNNLVKISSKQEISNYKETDNINLDDNKSVNSHQTGLTNLTQASAKTTITAVTYATEMLGNLSLLSFIILDLREKSEFDAFHIKEAISYPGPNISRDKFLPEMIKLDDKLIIIYGKDERSSIPYATAFYNKGYDNIFMLTGGIEEFVNEFPEKCEGTDVQKLINKKLQEEILKKDELLKKTALSKSNAMSKIIKESADLKSNNLSSKESQISDPDSKSIKQLKKNLQK